MTKKYTISTSAISPQPNQYFDQITGKITEVANIFFVDIAIGAAKQNVPKGEHVIVGKISGRFFPDGSKSFLSFTGTTVIGIRIEENGDVAIRPLNEDIYKGFGFSTSTSYVMR